MSEEFCRELSILIGLDDHAIVEELRGRICLSDLHSLQKWLLVETEVIESSICMDEDRQEEYRNDEKAEFFHIGFVIC